MDQLAKNSGVKKNKLFIKKLFQLQKDGFNPIKCISFNTINFYFKRIFPFFMYSKLKLKIININSIISFFKIEILLETRKLGRNKPAVLFWILYTLNYKINQSTFFIKKKYRFGKVTFIKYYLTIKKNLSTKTMIKNLNKIYTNLFNFVQEIIPQELAKIKIEKTYRFKLTQYNEDFFIDMISISPNLWINYNFLIKIIPKKDFSKDNDVIKFLLQFIYFPTI